jgi:hypothetical protein
MGYIAVAEHGCVSEMGKDREVRGVFHTVLQVLKSVGEISLGVLWTEGYAGDMWMMKMVSEWS